MVTILGRPCFLHVLVRRFEMGEDDNMAAAPEKSPKAGVPGSGKEQQGAAILVSKLVSRGIPRGHVMRESWLFPQSSSLTCGCWSWRAVRTGLCSLSYRPCWDTGVSPLHVSMFLWENAFQGIKCKLLPWGHTLTEPGMLCSMRPAPQQQGRIHCGRICVE